ncbi:MAG TPA: hypothetical protein VN878_05530, partial [Usitatibacter sp.]|nr:hypothetical protein [Usitatibacter sp.]
QEAKALAEARARAEAEAQALARARAEAESAAKRQSQQADSAEHQLRERLKEEIEARIRSEMEELMRNEFEEKTRAEMQSQIMAEAKLAAKAELEERLLEEREALHRAEADARVKAEADSRARADQEAKLRAQAEARAAAESEARLKAEAETRQLRLQAEEEGKKLRQAEMRAREESEARAREQKETATRLEAERRAKIEAEARVAVEAEERERRERELQRTIESERKAKEEAEMRARIETRARETVAEETRAKVQAEIEGDMEKRAEIEGKAQAKAYMHAKAKAELDEDSRLRAEQDRRAREIADILRTKVEPDEVAPEAGAPAARRRVGRRKGVVKSVLYGVVVVILLGIGLLHVVPMPPAYTTKVERTMSGWLHDDVSIGTLKFQVFPSPHLKLENFAVGKLLDARAAGGKIYLDISTLFGDRLSINSVELDGVSLSSEAVRRIRSWAEVEGKAKAGEIDRIALHGVKLDVKPPLEVFDANLLFSRQGALTSARLFSASGWSALLKPVEGGMDVDFSARHWALPAGVSIPVGDVRLKGLLTTSGLVVPEFEADALEGKVNGTLNVNWDSGIRLESNLSLARANAQQLVGIFTKDISITGKLDGNFSVASEAPSLETLFSSPRAQGKFRIADGSVSNIDLVAVMQSEAAGQRAGVTKFVELSGEMATAEHRVSFRQVALQGGVLRGNGSLDVGPNSALAGHIALEIRSQVAQDRGTFVVSGTVSRPIIRRGG